MDYTLAYDILKALHLIAMVAWFAGLFYFPRLLVYHVNAPEAARAMLSKMERMLYKVIMTPALMATWLFGLALLAMNPFWFQQGWLHAKLTLVVILTAYHISLRVFAAHLQKGTNTRSENFFRLYNEVPTVVLITVVFLVVLKPL